MYFNVELETMSEERARGEREKSEERPEREGHVRM